MSVQTNENTFDNLATKLKQLARKEIKSKYMATEEVYNLKVTNDLIFNEKCRIVAKFKDYLIYDDSSEFFRRFYNSFETQIRLDKILNFYHTYSKIFPNYIIIPESVYLYKNIRRKQKMIDACNIIKQEEEENRKQVKIEQVGLKENKVFDQEINESILRYQPSVKTLLNVSNVKEADPNMNNNQSPDLTIRSFLNENEESSVSLAQMITLMDKTITSTLVTEYAKGERQKERTLISTRGKLQPQPVQIKEQAKVVPSEKTAPKRFISHKVTSSVPESGIKIINNFQNIILPHGSTLININNNYYNCKTLPTKSESPNRNFNNVYNSDKGKTGNKLNANVALNGLKFGVSSAEIKLKPKDEKKAPVKTHVIKTKPTDMHSKIISIFKENYKTISNSNSNLFKSTSLKKEHPITKAHQSAVPCPEIANKTNNMETERIEPMLSKNEMKQRYRQFLGQNKLECLTTRNSLEVAANKGRLSQQINNHANIQLQMPTYTKILSMDARSTSKYITTPLTTNKTKAFKPETKRLFSPKMQNTPLSVKGNLIDLTKLTAKLDKKVYSTLSNKKEYLNASANLKQFKSFNLPTQTNASLMTENNLSKNKITPKTVKNVDFKIFEKKKTKMKLVK